MDKPQIQALGALFGWSEWFQLGIAYVSILESYLGAVGKFLQCFVSLVFVYLRALFWGFIDDDRPKNRQGGLIFLRLGVKRMPSQCFIS